MVTAIDVSYCHPPFPDPSSAAVGVAEDRGVPNPHLPSVAESEDGVVESVDEVQESIVAPGEALLREAWSWALM